MPFVLTADQRASRRGRDRVPEALDRLAGLPMVRPFERTAGDEFQGVLADANAVVEASLLLLRDGRWSVGVGCGPVELPLPRITRAGRGHAFQAARVAVEAAKQRPQRIAVRSAARNGSAASSSSAGEDHAPVEACDAEAVLALLGAIIDQRTAPGWEAVDTWTQVGSITAAAKVLGVTRQAVGQRLATARIEIESAGRATAARLLLRCLGTSGEDAAS